MLIDPDDLAAAGDMERKRKLEDAMFPKLLSRTGQRKLQEWVALLQEQGWSKPDKQFLVDYWLEHHDEDGVVIANGHPLYSAALDEQGDKK